MTTYYPNFPKNHLPEIVGKTIVKVKYSATWHPHWMSDITLIFDDGTSLYLRGPWYREDMSAIRVEARDENGTPYDQEGMHAG